jgi:hypothetical protein
VRKRVDENWLEGTEHTIKSTIQRVSHKICGLSFPPN